MKKHHFTRLAAAIMLAIAVPSHTMSQEAYTPSAENVQARQDFAGMKFGIFIHWGIYSVFGQGEWYMHNANLDWQEYAKAARAFYPIDFDAKSWVAAIKDAGARYITFTTRHHDGFSMWHTGESAYNIVEATPYGRDILRQLADECSAQGIMLNLYYSHLDWRREDYPQGRTGHGTGRDAAKADWPHYYSFMNRQLTELLTRYGRIGAIWFDGHWDHDEDATPFDWQLPGQYSLIHRLQPSCLVGNNHHLAVKDGEDIQIFERDVPGENKAGLSGQEVTTRMPLETCQTMNGMWGYKVTDQNYKSTDDLIRLLVRTAGKGANLLLNIGPQPNGELPATALLRLREMGQWLRQYGESIYGTTAGDLPGQPWGVTTRRGDTLYLHILDLKETQLSLPLRYKTATRLDGKPVKLKKTKTGIVLMLDEMPSTVDCVIRLE